MSNYEEPEITIDKLEDRILSLEWCVRNAIPALEATPGHRGLAQSIKSTLNDKEETSG